MYLVLQHQNIVTRRRPTEKNGSTIIWHSVKVIEFVCAQIKAFHEMLQTHDKTSGSIQSEKKNMAWVGDKPFLHFIPCNHIR